VYYTTVVFRVAVRLQQEREREWGREREG